MPMPAPTGTGMVCMLRSLGISNRWEAVILPTNDADERPTDDSGSNTQG